MAPLNILWVNHYPKGFVKFVKIDVLGSVPNFKARDQNMLDSIFRLKLFSACAQSYV